MQTFALLHRAGGIFPPAGWQSRARVGWRAAIGVHFSLLKIGAGLIGPELRGWHEACRHFYVKIGMGEGNG